MLHFMRGYGESIGGFLTLRRDADAFVQDYIVCQKMKYDRQKTSGLVHPLSIPDHPYDSIVVDFVFILSKKRIRNVAS